MSFFEDEDLEDWVPEDYRGFFESSENSSRENEFSVFQEVCEGRSYRAAEAAQKLIE